jgi:hypothetical protein
MRFLILLLLLTKVSLAQHSEQPLKESSSDLRTGLVVFSIEDMDGETETWLERTANLDYFLKSKDDDDHTKIQKITSKDAKKLDMEFASKFLKCQYELPPSPEGCKVTLRLTMKGENLDVCGKDEKKAQEIVPFLKELHKRF